LVRFGQNKAKLGKIKTLHPKKNSISYGYDAANEPKFVSN